MALTVLRGALGSSAIEADRESVCLSQNFVETDVRRFRATGEPSEYGGQLLPGMTDQWVVLESLSLEEEYADAVAQRIGNLGTREAADLRKQALRVLAHRPDLRLKFNTTNSSLRQESASPAFGTSFVGRQLELHEIHRLLSTESLVTLTGLGGSGKSRLAAELWRIWQPSSWFVRLADQDDPSGVAGAIRSSLGLPVSLSASAVDQVVNALGARTGLVVLDNFEHVLEARSVVSVILERCTGIKVVVTSQKRLNLQAEAEYRVGAMLGTGTGALPDNVSLFEERARAVLPSFGVDENNIHAVMELCDALDGFPLAIELAAARSRVFAPQEMLEQLGERMSFLEVSRGSLEARHQSLRSALDWGFERLSETQQGFLASLAVFRGGFSVESASIVCGEARAANRIDALIAGGWIERIEGMLPTRFRLLESIREYVVEFVRPRDMERLRLAHADYFVSLAEGCRDAYFTPAEREWNRRIDIEASNIDASYAWLLNRDTESCLLLLSSLDWYWFLRGLGRLGEARLREALSGVSSQPRTLLADAYQSLGNCVYAQNRYAEAMQFFQMSLEMATELNDRTAQGQSLCQLAIICAETGRLDEAVSFAVGAVERHQTNPNVNWLAAAYTVLGLAHNRRQDADAARLASLEAVALARLGGYDWSLASSLNELAMAYYLGGNFLASLECQKESIDIKLGLSAPTSLALSYCDQATVLLAIGDMQEATRSLQKCFHALAEVQALGTFPRAFLVGAELHLARGDHHSAAIALGSKKLLSTGRHLIPEELIRENRLFDALGPNANQLMALAEHRRLEATVSSILQL